MSLSNLLDIPQAQDYLRGLLNTMNEYDQAKEEPDKPKIVRRFSPMGQPETHAVCSVYSGPKLQSDKLQAVLSSTAFPFLKELKPRTLSHHI